MNQHDFKVQLMDQLLHREVWSRKVSDIQICTRCPWCGDSYKNPYTGHLYIRIDPNDTRAIVYNCFKCPAQGVLKGSDLEVLGIDATLYKDELQKLNMSSDMGSYTETKDLIFSYQLPTYYDSRKIEYLNTRMGKIFTIPELQDMKVITSLWDFMRVNDITTLTCKEEYARRIEDHYIGFLSSNGAFILFRDITGKEQISWFKYKITDKSEGQKCFYSISSEVDLFSGETITINLSEGVMDAIGIANHIMTTTENVVNIAVCGKYYVNIIKHLIGLGFVGSDIILNIFSDRDYTKDTSLEYHKYTLRRFKYIFKEVNVYYNTKEKDCGVRKEDISLERFRI